MQCIQLFHRLTQTEPFEIWMQIISTFVSRSLSSFYFLLIFFLTWNTNIKIESSNTFTLDGECTCISCSSSQLTFTFEISYKSIRSLQCTAVHGCVFVVWVDMWLLLITLKRYVCKCQVNLSHFIIIFQHSYAYWRDTIFYTYSVTSICVNLGFV